jgi:O-antigen/teichoic acid export membrane protein
VAYYLSSFHTLIVLILISIFYPTTQGYIFAGVYGLALSLIEILLVVPSALGNSMLHDIGDVEDQVKKKRFGTLMTIVVIIGLLVIANFFLFSPHIINFLGGEKYLTSATQIGSDWILPYLGGVITLSFIKQVFNYLFVSTNLHNKLLRINLF